MLKIGLTNLDRAKPSSPTPENLISKPSPRVRRGSYLSHHKKTADELAGVRGDSTSPSPIPVSDKAEEVPNAGQRRGS